LSIAALCSVVDLQAAINRFIAEYNADDPKPFLWKGEFALKTPKVARKMAETRRFGPPYQRSHEVGE